MHRVREAIAIALGFLFFGTGSAHPQSPSHEPVMEDARDNSASLRLERWKTVLNENAVTLMSGSVNGGDMRIAHDVAAVLDSGTALRVLPVIGKGAIQNMRDLMLLQGVDMAVVNLIALDHFRTGSQLGDDLRSHLAYITPLFHDELHLLARSGINTIRDLEGKRVNFSDEGDSALISSHTIFDRLGIKVAGANVSQADAIEMMKRGDLDASLCTCLKPLASHQALSKELGFKLVPIPYDQPLHKLYLPVTIGHDDYPNLIPIGQTVETVAVQTLLAVYNWPPAHPRYKKLAKFTRAFFENFEKFLQAPRHPRWKTVNLAAQISGWQRFPPAQQWLDVKRKSRTASNSENVNSHTTLEAFLTRYAETGQTGKLDREERDKLFDSFTRWLKANPADTAE